MSWRAYLGVAEGETQREACRRAVARRALGRRRPPRASRRASARGRAWRGGGRPRGRRAGGGGRSARAGRAGSAAGAGSGVEGRRSAPRTTSRHAARRIVDHAGEMIGGGRVLPREDRVAEVARVRLEASVRRLRSMPAGRRSPAPWPSRAASNAASSRAAPGSSGRPRQVPGYDARGVAVRRGQRLGDVGAGAEAGVDQALAPSAARARRHKLPCAATGPAPARPSRGRASADPRKCRRRTRAGCASGRDPRSAAGTCRRFPARGHGRSRRCRHGRGAAARSARARSA